MQRPSIALFTALLSLVPCVAAAAPAAVAPAAAVEPVAANPVREGARIFYDAGSRLFDQGMYQEALVQFESAYRLSKSPPLLYNMAICEERMQHARAAIVLLRRFIDQSPADEQRPVAEERIRKLEAQLPAEAPSTTPSAAPSAAPVVAGAVGGHRRFRGAWAGLALTGAFGLTAIGLGTYTAVHHDQLASSCGTQGGGCALDQRQALDRSAIAADVFIGLTGAAAVGTVIAFILEARAGRGAERRVARLGVFAAGGTF